MRASDGGGRRTGAYEGTQAALECVLREVAARLTRLRAEAEDTGTVPAARRLARLDRERLMEDVRGLVRSAASGEPGAATGAASGLRRVQAELDTVENMLRVPRWSRELREVLAECEDEATAHGDTDDRRALDDLCARADPLLNGAAPEAARRSGVEGARSGAEAARSAPEAQRSAADTLSDGLADRLAELLDGARTLRVRLLGKGGDWETTRFLLLCDAREAMAPRAEADALIARGRQVVRTGGGPELAVISDRLTRLLPQDVSGGGTRWGGDGTGKVSGPLDAP